MELRKDYTDNGFVFAKEFGEAEIVKKIETRMNRLLRITDLDPSFSPHTLRHTHATMLREKRVEFEYIQARLGHEKDLM